MTDFFKKKSPNKCFSKLNNKSTKADIALDLNQRGFKVIPLIPDSKKPSTKWDIWEGDVDEKQIKEHWDKYPLHGVGLLTNYQLCVLDADTKIAHEALLKFEKDHGCFSNMIVETKKGFHHYYLVPKDVIARLSAHSTEQHPERLDVKAGRSMVVGPYEEGKTLTNCDIQHMDELTPITQAFIDAVVRHNGGIKADKISPATLTLKIQKAKSSKTSTHSNIRNPVLAAKLLKHIDPDVGYGEWFIVAAGLHYEFEGSNEGLEVFDSWSKAGIKYTSRKDIVAMWDSLDTERRPSMITLSSIYQVALDNGAKQEDLPQEDDFEVIEKTQSEAIEVVKENDSPPLNPLHKFSLNGMSSQYRQQMNDDEFVLEGIALRGQITNIYAAPGSGKTLITMRLLMDLLRGQK